MRESDYDNTISLSRCGSADNEEDRAEERGNTQYGAEGGECCS